MSPNLRKRDQQITKNEKADFPHSKFSFVANLSHWCQDWVQVALACYQTAGMQPETRGVQSFTKSGARAAKLHARGGLRAKNLRGPNLVVQKSN